MYKHYIEQLESFNKKEPPVRRFQPQMQGTELEQLWANLSRGESKSLLKKHLTPERYKLLKDKKTKLGGTLADCIRSGKLYYVQLYACASTCISTGKKLGSENNWYSLLTLRRYNKFEKNPLWVMSKRTYGGLCHSSLDINRPNTQYSDISIRSSRWPDQPMKSLVTIAHCLGNESETSYKTKRNVQEILQRFSLTVCQPEWEKQHTRKNVWFTRALEET